MGGILTTINNFKGFISKTFCFKPKHKTVVLTDTDYDKVIRQFEPFSTPERYIYQTKNNDYSNNIFDRVR